MSATSSGRVRDDLLGREGYLVVLIMTIVVVVVIPIDATYRGGGIVTVAAIGLLVFTTMSRSKVSHRLRVASAVVIAISFVLAVVVTVTNNRAEARQPHVARGHLRRDLHGDDRPVLPGHPAPRLHPPAHHA